MKSDLSQEVQAVLGSFLDRHGFVLDEVVEGETHELAVVYYRSADCKLQVYYSPRHGEANCMLGKVDAPNEFGLYDRTKRWRFIADLTGWDESTPVEELIKNVPTGPVTVADQLTRIRDLLDQDFDAAHDALLNADA